jgi:hypothetical protein
VSGVLDALRRLEMQNLLDDHIFVLRPRESDDPEVLHLERALLKAV